MNVFNSIQKYLEKKEQNAEVSAPEGFCPNCWGHQEYGGDFFEAMRVEEIDLLNIEEKKGWIQAYAEKNLLGIQLQKKDQGLVCSTCNIAL
ncbi:hypothetical protein [Portibacter lacus]|uniref:Uncharacterized protein n=1 Tax=Portibacter lacus TaxID=1099794 RepID=A0AA37WHQ3_9BACT|nr:hypothetical protein [Portibacter lacus]GLR18990.1 hypothetical protein GCM10007940_36060 [Portibacter lacus]